MNKYISFLLVPIILFGTNYSSCYGMDDYNKENSKKYELIQSGKEITKDLNATIGKYYKELRLEERLNAESHERIDCYCTMYNCLKELFKESGKEQNDDSFNSFCKSMKYVNDLTREKDESFESYCKKDVKYVSQICQLFRYMLFEIAHVNIKLLIIASAFTGDRNEYSEKFSDYKDLCCKQIPNYIGKKKISEFLQDINLTVQDCGYYYVIELIKQIDDMHKQILRHLNIDEENISVAQIPDILRNIDAKEMSKKIEKIVNEIIKPAFNKLTILREEIVHSLIPTLVQTYENNKFIESNPVAQMISFSEGYRKSLYDNIKDFDKLFEQENHLNESKQKSNENINNKKFTDFDTRIVRNGSFNVINNKNLTNNKEEINTANNWNKTNHIMNPHIIKINKNGICDTGESWKRIIPWIRKDTTVFDKHGKPNTIVSNQSFSVINNKTKFDYWNKTNQISKTQSLTF